MNAIKKILNPSRQVMLANAATAGFAFITFFILVRTLGLTVFGEWVLYITAFNLSEMVRTGLARQALVHFLASSNSEEDIHAFKSSAFYLSLFVSVMAGLLFLIVFKIGYSNKETGVAYFFLFYPIASLASLIPSFDTWMSQANGKTLRMSSLTFLPALLFSFVGIASLWQPIGLLDLVILHVTTRAVLTLYSAFTNKQIIGAIVKPNLKKVSRLWSFGRYSIATLFGTNLLKSADNFLIAYFLGPAAVAIYNVPLKLLEIAEIPARSVGQVVFPKMSSLFSLKKFQEISNMLKSNVFKLVVWYFPVCILVFIFAEKLVVLVGGEDVVSSAVILKIFLVYVLLLPTDRLLGVAIDSTGAPRFNAIKVWIMVALNIIGDIVVLYFFENLWAVAIVTVLNVTAGVLVGAVLLKLQFERLGFHFTFNLRDYAKAA